MSNLIVQSQDQLFLVGFFLFSKKQALIPQYLKLTPWEELLLQQQPMLWFLSKKFWIWQTCPRMQLFVKAATYFFLHFWRDYTFVVCFTPLLLCYNMIKLICNICITVVLNSTIWCLIYSIFRLEFTKYNSNYTRSDKPDGMIGVIHERTKEEIYESHSSFPTNFEAAGVKKPQEHFGSALLWCRWDIFFSFLQGVPWG